MSITNTANNYLSNLAKKLIFWFRNLIPGRVKLSLFKSEEINRIRVVKLLEYYKGQMLYYLDYIIDNAYMDPMHRLQLKTRKNIKNIIDYITSANANLFKNGIVIEAINETDQDIYDNIAETNNLDILFKEIEKLVFLVKTVFVKVTWNEDEQNIRLYIVTPEVVEVETDKYDYCKLDRFTYMLNDVTNAMNDGSIQLTTSVQDQNIRFATWTKNEFKIFDIAGSTVDNQENPENINPYGIIPFVRFRDTYQYDSNFIQWPGDELESVQDNLNLHRTEFSRLQAFQSFSNPVLINPDKSMFDRETGALTFTVGPGTPIVLHAEDQNSPQPDFKYASPNPNFAALQESLNKDYTDILYQYGVNVSDTIASADKSSADAIQAASRMLEEKRENKRALYINAIKELFDVIQIVWNTHNNTQLKDSVKVKILDSEIYKSWDQRKSEYDWKLANNLITLPDILMEEEDVESIDEAQNILDANIEINKANQEQLAPAQLVQEEASMASRSGVSETGQLMTSDKSQQMMNQSLSGK